jgi:hypothetical protein
MPWRAKQALAHGRRISRIEDNVPERIGDPVATVHSLRAVVVKMCLFDMAEIPVLEVVVVLAMVDPLLKHIALNDTG